MNGRTTSRKDFNYVEIFIFVETHRIKSYAMDMGEGGEGVEKDPRQLDGFIDG